MISDSPTADSSTGEYGASDDDSPQVGSSVSLIPTAQPAPALSARLDSWLASPVGLAVTAEVSVDPSAVDLLAGESVWATFRTPDRGQLLVAALARPTSHHRERLELTGVAMIAREPRRDAIRAGLQREVSLVASGSEHSATTLDLSSGGCRVQVAEPEAFPVGHEVSVRLELVGDRSVSAAGQIVRSDPVAHEVAVRFLDLSENDEAALDALVYGSLSGSR